jgi:hypothetical protein
MCNEPSTAVFCSESIEFFPGMASKFVLVGDDGGGCCGGGSNMLLRDWKSVQ